MKTFLLLHGGMLGGWCWRKVEDRLRAAGHRVVAPTFTGMGERAHLLNRDIDHTTHVQDILNVIFYESLENIILVGHSYAGVIMPCVASATPKKITQIIHFDTFIPVHGESYFSAGPPAFAELFETLAKEKGDGWKLMPDKIFLKRWGVEEGAMADELFKKLTPIPIALFRKPILFDETIYHRIPHVFIGSAKTTAARQPALEIAAQKNWAVKIIDASHLAMITDPDVLTAAILSC